jgi:hypothetical protein
MPALDYASTGVTVRDDLRAAHARLWANLATPGASWSGAERVAIAAESRHAGACRLCGERTAALSPHAVDGAHDTVTTLPADAVEVAHRVRSDPGRLSKTWFERVTAGQLSVPAYVELVGIVAAVAGVDAFARALGVAPFPLPEPLPGAPHGRLSAGTKLAGAWVPMLAPEDAAGDEADLYGGRPFAPNIMRALSLVPDQVRVLFGALETHYVGPDGLLDLGVRRAIDRSQMELIAARVSALNQCFY